ncbi:hypothetical protein [Virgibacillus oceani]|uniref:Uncharacterized protein n=1 Tax=Virgibacillus oceani TaxID=1479511 RepID=A0A917LYU0_9BACI|nr:hypothetical protein [Virgibacillus oceani]GGG64620.1 hypothetical protein GCM10011398_05290 [Virgibacillus oceani]
MIFDYEVEDILNILLLILVISSFVTHSIHYVSSKASRQIMNNSRKTIAQKTYYFFLPAFETVTVDRMDKIRKYISDSNEKEVKNFKVGVNSELDRITHFAPMAVIITLLITAFLAIFSNIIPVANTWTNSILNHAINIKVSELEIEGNSKSEISDSLLNSEEFKLAPEFGERVSNVIERMIKNTLGINFEMFLFLAMVLGLYWIVHQFRLSKLLKIKYILNEFKFDEGEDFEENRRKFR